MSRHCAHSPRRFRVVLGGRDDAIGQERGPSHSDTRRPRPGSVLEPLGQDALHETRLGHKVRYAGSYISSVFFVAYVLRMYPGIYSGIYPGIYYPCFYSGIYPGSHGYILGRLPGYLPRSDQHTEFWYLGIYPRVCMYPIQPWPLGQDELHETRLGHKVRYAGSYT